MRTLVALTAAATVLLGCACSSTRVKHVAGLDAQWSVHQTYSFVRTADRPANPDGSVLSSPHIHRRLERAIGRSMDERGYERTAPETADLLIVYHLPHGYSAPAGDWRYVQSERFRVIAVSAENSGSLVVDIVDRQERQLIWRGWASNVFVGNEPSVQAAVEAAEEIIARIPASRPSLQPPQQAAAEE